MVKCFLVSLNLFTCSLIAKWSILITTLLILSGSMTSALQNFASLEYLVYLPIVISSESFDPPLSCGLGENEPNDTFSTATGPLVSGIEYQGCFGSEGDINDIYFFDLNFVSTVEIFLQDIPFGSIYDLVLYETDGTRIAISNDPSNLEEYIVERLQSGRYYIQVFNRTNEADAQDYRLRVEFDSQPLEFESEDINKGTQEFHIEISNRRSNLIFSVSLSNLHWSIIDDKGNTYEFERNPFVIPNMNDEPNRILIPPLTTIYQRVVIDKPVVENAGRITFIISGIHYEFVGDPLSRFYPTVLWEYKLP